MVYGSAVLTYIFCVGCICCASLFVSSVYLVLRGKVFKRPKRRQVSRTKDHVIVSRREQVRLDYLFENFKPIASCRDGVLYVRPIAPNNVFYVRGRKVICCSQMLFLQPDAAKGLLPKDRRPEDGPVAHVHCNRTLDGTDSEGPIKAVIALLFVKWRMRLVVIQPPYKGGTFGERSRALEFVLDFLEAKEILAANFIASLRSRYSLTSIKFSMDTNIAACMKSGCPGLLFIGVQFLPLFSSGRIIRAKFKDFILVNIYAPTHNEKAENRHFFLHTLLKFLKASDPN